MCQIFADFLCIQIDRALRRSLSTWLALLMVFLSILVTLGAKYFSVKYYNDTGTTGTCPYGFSSWDTADQKELVEADPTQYTHCYCSRLTLIEQAKVSDKVKNLSIPLLTSVITTLSRHG